MKLPHERPGYAWLFTSSGSRTMMEYYCTGGVLQYASGHLTPIELLHVCPPRAGRIACSRSTTKQKPVLVCEQPRAWVREKACSKIKLLLVVQVDATHHSTGPTCLPLNLAERPAVYNIFAATSNIYPPQIKIYVAICIVLM